MKDTEKCSIKISGARERCVICGRYTDMEKDWPVMMRKHYVEGAGQLCRRCYLELYADEN